MGYLAIENGKSRGERRELVSGGKITFGRDPKADLAVEDVLCSRRHFEVLEQGGKVILRDLGSSNGTFVNGERVDGEVALVNGDAIHAGESEFTWIDEPATQGRGLVGKTLGGYKIGERVGRGGMGTVYRATQVSLNRVIALKILTPKVSKDPAFVRRFQQEAQAAGRLNHPNIVQVYDVGSDKDLHFYSMEFIENGTVQDLATKQGALDPDLALAIVTDAARGLEYAEKKNIVHRDIKPDNLMINAEGVVKINDLGLAHDVAGDEAGGEIFGTPHFIAPEQARGEKVDSRSDLYSLGATFYRLLTGANPFQGENVQEILRKQIEEDPTPLREVKREIPAALEAIVLKLMKKAPEDRYQSATALLNDLERAAGGGDSAKKRPLLWAAAAVLLLGGGAAYWFFGRPPEPKPTPPPVQVPEPPVVQDDPERAAREAALLRETRLATAKADLSAIEVDDLKATGAGRTEAALIALRDRYQEIEKRLTDLSPNDVQTSAATKAAAIETERSALAAAIATEAAAAAERENQAKRRVADILERVRAQAEKKQLGLSLTTAINGLLASDLQKSQALADLAKAADEVETSSRALEEATTTEAEAKIAVGDFSGAAQLLENAAESFSFGLGEHERLLPLKAAAEKFRARASGLAAEQTQRATAEAQADQKLAFPARRDAVLAFRSGMDFAKAEAALQGLAEQLKTTAWRTLIEQETQSVAATIRVRDAFIQAVKGKVNTLKLPTRGDNPKWVNYQLLEIDSNGMLVRIGSAEPRRVQFSELSALPFHDNVLKGLLPPSAKGNADLAELMIWAGEPAAAITLLAGAAETDPLATRLRKQAQEEEAARALLAEVRTLETQAARDPKFYLKLLPKVEAFVARYSATRTFAPESRGDTPPLVSTAGN